MFHPLQHPNIMLFSTLAIAIIALIALAIGIVVLANVAGGLAQLLVLVLPIALLSHALL